MRTEYDYVIVGAGSAGCVMASRLSENPDVSVCLLEAGKPDKDFRIHIPGMIGSLLGSRVIDWSYYTTPQRELNDRRLFWPRGKTLGGSSSLNAMCYQRGDLSDYDDWAREGAEGWSAMDALHYFKRSEDYSGGESQWHGGGGPLGVKQVKDIHPATQAYIDAGKQAGYGEIEDFHATGRDGVGVFDATIRDGKRCSTATAFLPKSVRSRANLEIVTQALGQRVVFDGKTAVGVEASVAGEVMSLVATREVILCGGAVNTPQLLLLSGVGPSAHLQEKGVELVADRPGVGENLQDHLDLSIMVEAPQGKTAGYSLRSVVELSGSMVKYLFTREGALTSNMAEGNGFARSSPDIPKADIQFVFVPAFGEDHAKEKLAGHNGFIVHGCNLYPTSRGTIRLASTDPNEHPEIEPNYLSTEEDWDVMIEAGKKAFEISDQPALKEFTKKRWMPTERPDTRNDWEALIRARAETIYHPVGTCKMGAQSDEMAVTDTQGRVYGVHNLRVVDASLMPLLVGGNTNAPTIMMAEKISDVMKTA